MAKANFSDLATDMHSHILPGLDDGAPDLETSLALARKFVDLGYQQLIATPHIMGDFYRNTPSTINRSLEQLQNELLARKISIEICAAAEYFLDEAFLEKLKKKEVMTFGKDYLLFEISYINAPTNLLDTVLRIQDAGYQPVLAHPERYFFYHHCVEKYQQLKQAGCLLQLNMLSLTKYYGAGVKKIAEQLVANHCIDFLGSDVHHHRHMAALENSFLFTKLDDVLLKNQLKNSSL